TGPRCAAIARTARAPSRAARRLPPRAQAGARAHSPSPLSRRPRGCIFPARFEARSASSRRHWWRWRCLCSLAPPPFPRGEAGRSSTRKERRVPQRARRGMALSVALFALLRKPHVRFTGTDVVTPAEIGCPCASSARADIRRDRLERNLFRPRGRTQTGGRVVQDAYASLPEIACPA